MPKRTSESSEESQRKVVRKSTSRSPSKTQPLDQIIQDEASQDLALTNVSEDEDIDDKSSSAKVDEAVEMVEIIALDVLRELFFDNFLQDVSTDSAVVDVEGYKRLFKKVPEEDVSEKRALIDQYMKDFVLQKILQNREKWNRFLELSIKLSREDICSASIPIALISDLVELSNLQDCEGIFDYVEDRLSVWKEPLFLHSGKNAVLRMCNDLLRRLSRAQNTIFCGRILIFLANYFPFSERSGLNIMSEFNVENITQYKSGDGSDDPEDKMEIVEESDEKLFEGMDLAIPGLDRIVSITQEEKKNKVKVDYNLYVKFWSLQDFFRHPLQCYNKIAWKTFTMYTQDVLGAFTCFKIQNSHFLTHKSNKTSGENHSATGTIPKLGDEDLYFPKYLTNRRLLELQMGDPSFRRYFMVQLLIILQYLTTSVKFKTENMILTDEQQDFIKKTTERIYKLLGEIKPGGKEFVKAVQHIMKREELWSKWKNDGCQPFKKPVAAGGAVNLDAKPVENKESKDDEDKKSDETASTDDQGQPVDKKIRRHLGDIIEEATANNRYLMGNSELTRLWNICGDNLEACRSKSRDFLPSMEGFFVEAMKELDPEPTPPNVVADPSKREIKPKKTLGNANFGWRALRLLARKSPYFFQMFSGSPIHPLQNYLEFIMRKIAIDLEMPIPKDETQENNKGVDNDDKPTKESSSPRNNEEETPTDGEQIVEGGADENDELLKTEKDEVMEEDEEGEVDEKVRNLTPDEQKALGKALGIEWKKVALKLGFTTDEIEFFETDKGTDAGAWMLTMWTEQEKDDANVADLLYQLEGLKLRELVKDVFP